MSLRCQRIVPFVFVLCSALSTGALAQDPVPTADEQAETLTLVREIYFDDYRAANTAQAKVDLARRILTDGEETVDDPIGRYVLFKLARDIAVQAGDLATTRSAVESIAEDYEVDRFELRLESLDALVRQVDGAALPELMGEVTEIVAEAVEQHRFAEANEILDQLIATARRARAREVLSLAQRIESEVEDAAKAYMRVKPSLLALEEDPSDPKANLRVGRYLCFVKRDWKQGLEHLAKADDGELSRLALAETDLSKDTGAALSVADGWWKISLDLEGVERAAVRVHAAGYYRRAMEHLTGLKKAKAQSRIEEAEKLGLVEDEPSVVASGDTADREGDSRVSLEISPFELPQKKVSYDFPAPFDDVCLAAGGRYFVFYFQSLNQLGFFDVNEGKITKYVPVENAELRFTAGAESFYIALRRQNVIQRWSLATFEKELTVKLPFSNPVDQIATGPAATAPIFAGAKDAPGIFLDPRTLRPMPIKMVDHVYQRNDAKIPGAGPESRVRVSANGRVFGLWRTQVSPGGFNVLILARGGVHHFYEHDTMGYIAPSPEGDLIYTSRGVFTNQTKEYSANLENFAKSFPVPAVQGEYSLWINRDDNHEQGEDATTSVTVHVNGESQPILTLNDIALRPGGYSDFHNRDPLTLDRRLWLIPAANLIISLPESNKRLVMHRFDLEAELDAAGIDYLFVTSRPPTSVRRGATFNYQINSRSKHEGVTYRLESGPKGMKVSDSGHVTWRTSRREMAQVHDVIVAVQDSSGQEITYTFKVLVE